MCPDVIKTKRVPHVPFGNLYDITKGIKNNEICSWKYGIESLQSKVLYPTELTYVRCS